MHAPAGTDNERSGSAGVFSPMNQDFYTSIEPVADFELLADEAAYRRLPAGWFVAAADVANSTVAITEGRYRAVNMVGVAVIAAIRNAIKPAEIPYVFGGDGAVLCVPPEFEADARRALAATVAMARESFGLTLRAAVVPVDYVREIGFDVLVARHQVSAHYIQCGLFGGGAVAVEDRLKAGGLPEEFIVTGNDALDADFKGVECRWQEVPSPAEETVAVIVEVDRHDPAPLKVYRWVMERTREIYGEVTQCRPVSESELRLSLDGSAGKNEAALRSWKASGPGALAQKARMRVLVLIGAIAMRLGIKVDGVDWGRYKSDMVANTDFRKFDGSVRFVLTGSRDQRRQLERFLDDLWASGTLQYGIHVSESALMTCLIDEYQGEHFHFVDASGGGYARAAAHMKTRLPPTP